MSGVRVAPVDDPALAWDDAGMGDYARALQTLGQDGALANARFGVAALQLADRCFVVVAPTGAQHCWLTSLRATYGKAARDEVARDLSGPRAWLFRAASLTAETWLALTDADRAVYVNHLLFSTSLYGGWTGTDLTDALAALRGAYPDRAIVFRSLNAPDHPGLLAAIKTHGARLIASRVVWRLADPAAQWSPRTDVKADLALPAAHALTIRDAPNPAPAEIERCLALYRDIYLAKYSAANPDYRPALLQAAVVSGVLGLQLIEGTGGDIQAFAAEHVYQGLLSSPMLGHDRAQPQARGLYRVAMAVSVLRALEQGLAVNYSAGAGAFKRNRGARPTVEYMAVFDAHLPRRRRAGYGLLARAVAALTPSLERIATA